MTASSNNSSPYEEPEIIRVKKRDILFSDSTRYLVMDIMGEGTFGQVAKCLNLNTGKTTAVKINKRGDHNSFQMEKKMLEAIRSLDTEKTNILKFIEDFKSDNYACLAFEMLDRSLRDLMLGERKSLSLNEIRPVTQQLMVAFKALKGLGIIHLDLKPDNVMLVNHKDEPFRIKLIDFGVAHPVGVLEVGLDIQCIPYRAPEVMLGLPLTEAVDIWAVGCIMGFLYFGCRVFPFNCEYQWMEAVLQLLGQPEDHQLNDAIYTGLYFNRAHGSTTQRWKLKTREEFRYITGTEAGNLYHPLSSYKNLENAVATWYKKKDDIEYEDRMAFLSLLKGCLHLDPAKRISAAEALKHRFITMAHLVSEMGTSSYVDAAFQHMTVSYRHHTESSSEDEGTYREDYSAGEEAVADSSGGADRDIMISSCKYSDRCYDADSSSHANFYDGVRDTVILSKEDDTNTDCLLGASNTNDRGSADIGPTDGVHDKTRPDGRQRRTIFQRASKVFRRVKKRVVSLFRCHKN